MKILLLILVLMGNVCMAQVAQDRPVQAPKKTAQHINGVYIPADMDDCLIQFEKNWSAEMKDIYKGISEEVLTKKYAMLHDWIMDNWGLWKESRLAKYFYNFGMYHPEDMASMIMITYHRQINGREIRLREQIEYYRDYWKMKERSRPDITPEKLQKAAKNEEKQ